jgi:hypothetical protein
MDKLQKRLRKLREKRAVTAERVMVAQERLGDVIQREGYCLSSWRAVLACFKCGWAERQYLCADRAYRAL